MTNDVRQSIAASISPDLVREACEEAKARSAARPDDFYAQLAMSLKRRVAAPLADSTPWGVILVAVDGSVRALLSSVAPRFLEPRGSHDDVASGAFALWFSVHHEKEIAPFASLEEARRAVEEVIATIAQPGLRDRLRIVPASRKGDQELLLHLASSVAASAPSPAAAPAEFLKTQVFKAYVEPAKPD